MSKTVTGGTVETGRVSLDQLSGMMSTFGLRHAAKNLSQLLEDAESRTTEPSYREFLRDVLTTEAKGRNEHNRDRNYAAAHFPPNPKPLEEYDVTVLNSGITSSQIHQLEDMNWVDAHGNLVFVGKPGVGKTTLAVGFGVRAVDEGYTVAFETMENFVKLMDNESTDRASGFRMKNIRRADMVIIDEIGYTPITRAQANHFYNFVSQAHGKTSLVFTTNKAVANWTEILGDKDLTAALLDRILSHARCFLLDGPSYRLTHPEVF